MYFVRFGGMTIDSKVVGVFAGAYHVPSIIDSGTVITRLPETIYTALKQAFVKVMSTKYSQAASFSILDACFKGRVKSLSVPQIKMVFRGGIVLALNARNILAKMAEGHAAVIQNYQQQILSVAYDVFNSRTGFVAGGCD